MMTATRTPTGAATDHPEDDMTADERAMAALGRDPELRQRIADGEAAVRELEPEALRPLPGFHHDATPEEIEAGKKIAAGNRRAFGAITDSRTGELMTPAELLAQPQPVFIDDKLPPETTGSKPPIVYTASFIATEGHIFRSRDGIMVSTLCGEEFNVPVYGELPAGLTVCLACKETEGRDSPKISPEDLRVHLEEGELPTVEELRGWLDPETIADRGALDLAFDRTEAALAEMREDGRE